MNRLDAIKFELTRLDEAEEAQRKAVGTAESQAAVHRTTAYRGSLYAHARYNLKWAVRVIEAAIALRDQCGWGTNDDIYDAFCAALEDNDDRD